MEENLQQEGQPAPTEGAAEVMPPIQLDESGSPKEGVVEDAAKVTTQEYASFFRRLGAWLVDAVILGIVGAVVGGLFASFVGTSDVGVGGGYGLLPTLISAAYFVFMDVKYGATLGKMALGLRVQSVETGENLTVLEAILREIVGKMISSFVFGLGYFWVLWDSKRQAWHDKIGKSVVVRVG